MKSILPYIFLMTGTLVAAVAIIGGIYYLKPQLLGIVKKPPQASAQKDSTAAHRDSLAAKPPVAVQSPGTDSTLTGPPAPVASKTGETVSLADSIRILNSRIDEQKKTIARLTEKAPGGTAQDSVAKSPPSDSAHAKDSKSFAKMLEGMPAEQAVRILKGLDDREVKAVLLTVKKRQAAKILSALDPDRAARMIRTLQ
jgi:hypothetical protein